MRIVHSWLEELVPVGDDIDMIAETMTDLGLVVDEIIQVGATVEGVITARVVRTERHPDAAKVHRVFVESASCGAARSTCRPTTSFPSPRPARRCPMGG
jgi:phenylalanyl-tRNA synthetase beta chain